MRLEDLSHCFHGIVPSVIATCAGDGTPNITYLSHVYFVDSKHVALSCQFFNKTRQNIAENPHACIEMYDPVTFEAYRLRLRYVRSETQGPLFDQMSLRIDAIASQSGMSGVFRLISADIYEVDEVDEVPDFLSAPPSLALVGTGQAPDAGPMTELRALQLVSSRINSAATLDDLLSSVLGSLHEAFGFEHSMLLLADESGKRLFAVASHGYGESGVGAEVVVGEGLIGTVAAQRRMIRLGSTHSDLRYGRAIRNRVEQLADAVLRPEVPLPGLPNAQSSLVLPLLVQNRLIGVLATESSQPYRFEEWHEAFLGVICNQIAIAIDNMTAADDDDDQESEPPPPSICPGAAARKHTFWFFNNDDCVFVDGEYLIRNVPGRILWKILNGYQREQRTEFSNRELRLDPSLGLPAVKDNLESRLILLRKRLEQKCPDIRLVSTGRGRFMLELDCAVELVEKMPLA